MGNTKTTQFAPFLRLMALARWKGESCLTAMLDITEGDSGKGDGLEIWSRVLTKGWRGTFKTEQNEKSGIIS